jgi:preprotein translocase subunit SecF
MSIFRKLYRGETNINFIGNRRRWYAASAVLILICIISFIVRGFNYGIEFKGGVKFQISDPSGRVTATAANDAFSHAGVTTAEPAQVITGSSRQIVVQTKAMSTAEQQDVTTKIVKDLGVPASAVSAESVSSSWGHDTTTKALQGLILFLIAVTIYISLRFQWRMAVGGMAALLHDLVIAAGIYSLIGFEVTPSTIVGLLTILGFSLYDTVVVYDKVAENSKDILAGSKTTYSEAANAAVNQTLMRSINTSLIALLPVAGLLFVGAGLLGVGTIKDLALILFVGLASGAYSSLFLATPVVVDLTERVPEYKQLTKRVVAKRASDAKRADSGELATAAAPAARRPSTGPMPAPRPGARPQRRKR